MFINGVKHMKLEKRSVLALSIIFTLIVGFVYLPLTAPSQAERALIFGINVQVNDDTGNGFQNAPRVLIGSSAIYAIWDDWRNGNSDIYFSKSADAGLSFGDGIKNNNDIRVDDDSSGASQKNPAIAIYNNDLYAVWQDDRDGNVNIYFAKSTDGGVSFGTSVRVDDSTGGSQSNPDIAITSTGVVYVTWQDNRRTISASDYDMYFAKSTDGGSSFQTNVRVDDTGSTTADQKFPRMVLSPNDDIYIVWDDRRNGDRDIYFSKSTNGGAGFMADVRVDHTSFGSDQMFPTLATSSSGTIYIVWEDERNGGNDPDIYMAKSTNSGSSFGGIDTRVDDTGATSSKQTKPSIDVDTSGGLHIVWTDTRNDNQDIYYASSTDGGTTFNVYKRVDDTGTETSTQQDPAIVVSSSALVCIAWKDGRNGNQDIYFSKLVEEGAQGWAPTLHEGEINKDLGDATEEFKYTVKYVDKEDDAPAAGYPKLYIYIDQEGSAQYTGSPFGMTKQVFPTQDGDYTNGEIYEYKIVLGEEHNYAFRFEAKADSGNLSFVKSALFPGPTVDMTPVAFSEPIPSAATWNNGLKVTCNITITDFGGSGVKKDTIQFAFSTNGVDNYGVFKQTTGIKFNEGEDYINCSVEVTFQDGVNNYIKWRADDNLGNGVKESPDYQIKIDSTKATFADPSPDPEFWNNEETINCEITVQDLGGSGVDAGSIVYLLIVGGTSTGDWQNAGKTEDNVSIKCSVEAEFVNGTDNYIRWRAFDIAGNGPAVSVEYQVKINTGRELNHRPEPPTQLEPLETGSKRPNLYWNQGNDQDGDTLEYYIQIGTTSGGSEVMPWLSTAQSTSYQVKTDLEARSYYVQLKAYDGEYYSPVFEQIMNITLTGNTPPQPPNTILPDKIRVGSTLRISWSGASDSDGDNLTYSLQVGRLPWVGDEMFWVGAGTKEYFDVPINMEFLSQPGVYYIQIMAHDGTEFSSIYQEILEVANYVTFIEAVDLMIIEQSKSNTTDLTITNLGTSMDNITLNISGSMSVQTTIILEKTKVTLSPNSSTTVKLSIKIHADQMVKDYELIITANSEDGRTKFDKSIIIRVEEFTGKDGNGPDPDDDDSRTRNPLVGFFLDFWWLILLLIIVIVAVGIVSATLKARKTDERTEEQDKQKEYDRLYGGRRY